MGSYRPRYLPVPYQDSLHAGRLLLRDGTSASIRVARVEDKDILATFFASLSADSIRQRFFSLTRPQEKQIDAFCDSANPKIRLSLVVTEISERGPAIIACGTYVARDETIAEVALAVDDHCHGNGIGTLVFERLALIAAINGFSRLWAVTMAENRAMIDVFRNSGFEQSSRYDGGYVEIDLSVMPNAASVARAELRDRVATTASILPFFHPRAVAVIGASRNSTSIGSIILHALIDYGYCGQIYPVNPSAATLAALTAYPSVKDIPQVVDLAVITTPPSAVLKVVDDCAARGVKAVLVITAGFAEIGEAGKELQQKLLDKVRGYGMRMVGPNCLGLMNTDPLVHLNASFAPHLPPAGRIGFCSQSGALGLAVIALARERGLGLSGFVSVGNKADVSGNDLLQYWEEDEHTDVILLYLESFGNPRRFGRIAARVGRHKPIVTVKAGRTGAGRRAAGSHTAALAASDVATEALFHQTGVIRADSLDELFDLALALSSQPLPSGRRVGVLTNAGGLGILCADACEAAGLTVESLSELTKKRLREFLPNTASVANPVDMIASASADNYRQGTETLLACAEIDALVVLTIDVGLADIAAITRSISAGVADAHANGTVAKTVLTCIMDPAHPRQSSRDRGKSLPDYAFPEHAARVLGKLAKYADWRRQPVGLIPEFDDLQPNRAREVCRQALIQRGPGWLSSAEACEILTAFQLPTPSGVIAPNADDAVQLAATIGYPVALKLASTKIVHKTEVGGVSLNLEDETAVRQAFAAIRQRLAQENQLDAMDGVLVQPMLSDGVEVMIGITQDPLFGPLIAFGLGGIHVEIINDVCFRVTPISDRDASDMVQSIRGYRLLQGFRGRPPGDIAAVEDLLLRVSRLVEELPEVVELDLNPIFVLPPGKGCMIVDARIRVTE